MDRKNKKEAIAALHRRTILQAAEQIIVQKGFAATTIADICQAAQYSRRTLYAYFNGKEDILYHIVLEGLSTLQEAIWTALSSDGGFVARYEAVCAAMKRFYLGNPQAFAAVDRVKSSELTGTDMPPVIEEIVAVGSEINRMLADFIAQGQAQGSVRAEIKPMPTVYILWAGISSLLTLTHTKGPYLEEAFAMSEEEFLAYGLRQLINAILEVRI